MRKFSFLAILGLLALGNEAQAGPITMDVYASAAPNAFGSPNWAQYVTNSITGIQNGGMATGTAGTPSYYESGAVFDPGAFIVASFPLWMGEPNPVVPFDAEYGNRMHFGLRAESDDAFALDEVTFDMDSSDPFNSLDFDGNYAGLTYSSTRVGVNYGGDGVLGGGDDTIYNSGQSAALLVNALYLVGVGNAFWPGDLTELADTIAYIESNGGNSGPFTQTTTYSIKRDGQTLASATGTATVTSVPEPSTMLLFSFGAVALCFGRRRQTLQGLSLSS